MAENKVLNTRIGLKIDTLENWNKSTLGLLKGEIAIATVASSAGTQLSEPVCMIKIGEDGVKTFSQLSWNFYAKASDVITACKSEEALTTFINNVIDNGGLATDEELAALADGEFMVKLNEVNTNGSAKTVDVIVAYYRANGSLAKVSKTKATIENGANGEVTKNIVIAKTADTASVDIMCWKSLDSVKPMSQKIEL